MFLSLSYPLFKKEKKEFITQRRCREPYYEILWCIWNINAHISYLSLGNVTPRCSGFKQPCLLSHASAVRKPGASYRAFASRPPTGWNQGFSAGWVLLCGIPWGRGRSASRLTHVVAVRTTLPCRLLGAGTLSTSLAVGGKLPAALCHGASQRQLASRG